MTCRLRRRSQYEMVNPASSCLSHRPPADTEYAQTCPNATLRSVLASWHEADGRDARTLRGAAEASGTRRTGKTPDPSRRGRPNVAHRQERSMKILSAARFEARSFAATKGYVKHPGAALSALIVLMAIVLAGNAWAQQPRCSQGQCFMCNGLLACRDGTCTCNGAPAQKVAAPKPARSKAQIFYECEMPCQSAYVMCDPSPYRPNEAKCKAEHKECVSRCIARD